MRNDNMPAGTYSCSGSNKAPREINKPRGFVRQKGS